MSEDLPDPDKVRFKVMNYGGVPEGGLLPDSVERSIYNLEDGDTWIDLPPPKGMSIGGGAFRVKDWQDIPIVIDDGQPPPPPTRWQKFKSRIYWKWDGVRSWLAHKIYPEGFDDDW